MTLYDVPKNLHEELGIVGKTWFGFTADQRKAFLMKKNLLNFLETDIILLGFIEKNEEIPIPWKDVSYTDKIGLISEDILVSVPHGFYRQIKEGNFPMYIQASDYINSPDSIGVYGCKFNSKNKKLQDLLFRIHNIDTKKQELIEKEPSQPKISKKEYEFMFGNLNVGDSIILDDDLTAPEITNPWERNGYR